MARAEIIAEQDKRATVIALIGELKTVGELIRDNEIETLLDEYGTQGVLLLVNRLDEAIKSI